MSKKVQCICHYCQLLKRDIDENGESSFMYGTCRKNGMRVAQYHNTENPECPKKKKIFDNKNKFER